MTNYTQTWKTANTELKTISIGFARLVFDIVLSLIIVTVFSCILNWVDTRVSYQPKIKYKDVPAYTEHADQRFIRDFFQTGYVNKNIQLSLL